MYATVKIPGSLAINLPTVSLPCACDTPCTVSQGYEDLSQGKYAHDYWDRFSVDFNLAEGSPVHAITPGTVLTSIDHSNKNCMIRSLECNQYTNRIVILGEDGSLIEYLHLKQGGNKVDEGDKVKDRQLIALSGNTGFSSGPHLHLAVIGVTPELEQETVPLLFKTQAGVIHPRTNKQYSSDECAAK